MPISHRHTKLPQLEYIEEKNIEDSLALGKFKQNAYDENVKNLNLYYDSLEDFQPTKNSDKQFYRNELNRINKVLTESVGSADFSNINTVKSLINVANPLMKDPRFKNIMASEAELKRRQDVTTKIKPGDFNAANYDLFMDDYQQWLNDPEPGKKLGYKEYIPYKDISKEFTEKVKQMTPEISTQISKLRGMGLIAETEVKRMEGAIIAKRLMNTLSSEARTQLEIDMRYQMKNVPDEIKSVELMNFYGNAYNATSDPTEKKAYKELFESAKQGDVSSYGNYYMANYFGNTGEMYSVNEVKTNVTTDPLAMAYTSSSIALKQYEQKILLDRQYGTGDFAPSKTASSSGKQAVTKIFNDETTNAITLDKLNRGESITVNPYSAETLNGDLTKMVKILKEDNPNKDATYDLQKQGNKLIISYKKGDEVVPYDTGIYLEDNNVSSSTPGLGTGSLLNPNAPANIDVSNVMQTYVNEIINSTQQNNTISADPLSILK
jgi:hypothetical protein